MSNECGRAALVLGIGGIVAGRSFTPGARQRVWQFLDDFEDAVARARQRQQRRALQEPAAILDSSSDPWERILLGGSTAPRETSDQQPSSTRLASFPCTSGQSVANVTQRAASLGEPEAAWRRTLQHPAVVLILGKRGSGKSALAYRLLELFRYQLMPYVVGAPDQARPLLPDWIGMAPSLDAIPPKSIVLIVLVDDAYLRYRARESQAQQSREMSRLLNLSRQREQTLIFVTLGLSA